MKTAGFVCFGEINTPFDILQKKHDDALKTLGTLDNTFIIDAGIVFDDAKYETADKAIEELKGKEFDCLIVCISGWIPTHAVIRVTDIFKHIPILLWGLCGWFENGRLMTTADQAGTTALRPAFEAMGYTFKFVYSIVGKQPPIEQIEAFLSACYAKRKLRSSRVGTMGYRDMLLYGTQFEGNSMRGQLGVEVEPFEMLEIVQNVEAINRGELEEGAEAVKKMWKFKKPCDDSVIEKGVSYALALRRKVQERGYDAISLIDVDGMKKLLDFPPAMVFMLLDQYCDITTIPENDIMGAVTQLIMKFVTGHTAPYLEYYEFFEKSMLIGVPDYIPKWATDGDTEVLPVAFGLLSASLLNVSKVKAGYVTCARLIYFDGDYKMHLYTAEAKRPNAWEECGWESPAPQLPSLEVFPDSCSVEEFAQKVSSQHVIIGYGNHMKALKDFCALNEIETI